MLSSISLIMSDSVIKESIQKLAGTHLKDEIHMVTATVIAVDQNSRTCTCTPISGKAVTDLGNVLLMPEVDDGFLKIPAIGSTVIVMWSTKNVPYIAMTSALQMVYLVTLDGIILTGTDTVPQKAILGETLVGLLGQLITAIENITVDTPSGVSSVPLNTVDLESIKQSLFQCYSSIVQIG